MNLTRTAPRRGAYSSPTIDAEARFAATMRRLAKRLRQGAGTGRDEAIIVSTPRDLTAA